MSQSKSRKLLDAQARLIAKEDRKFVAKLSGQKWTERERKASEDSSSPSSGSSSTLAAQPRSAPVESILPSSARGALSTAPALQGKARHPKGSHVSHVAPDFQPPDARPAWLKATSESGASTAAGDTASEAAAIASSATDEAAEQQQEYSSPMLGFVWQAPATAPAAAYSHTAGGSSVQSTSWLPSSPDHGPSPQQIENLYLAAAGRRSSSPAVEDAVRPGSPSWLLKASMAGFQVQPGPVQVESSLYANWATSYFPGQSEASGSSARRPASPPLQAPAMTSAGRSALAGELASSMAWPTANNGQQQQEQMGTVAATAAAQLAMATAAGSTLAGTLRPGSAVRASSPTGTRRAAAAVAGIGKAGMNPKYQGWLKQQFPGVKPPRREDAASLRQWLDQQLVEVHQLLQQQTHGSTRQAQQNGGLRGTYGSPSLAPKLHPGSPAVPRCASPNSMRRISASGGLFATGTVPASTSDSGYPAAAESWDETGLEQQTSQLIFLALGPDGALDVDKLQLQEAVYSAAYHELCRQVSVGCVEHGHLMAQLWLSLRAMLLAALEDRQAARAKEAAAHATTAAVKEEFERLQTLQQDEKVALRAISERHSAKAEDALQEMEKYKHKCEQLQDLLERVSAAQQLVQRVFDLEKVVSNKEAFIKRLENQVKTLQEQIDDLSSQVQTWKERALAAEGVREGLEQQLECSTPRPRRDLGLLSDMLSPAEAQLVEQALVAGVPPLHVHRLLLGLSPEGVDMRQWVGIAGCAVQALKEAKDPYQMYQHIQQLLVGCNALGLLKLVHPPESIQLLSQAVHVGAAPAVLLQLMDGSLGLPLFGHSEKAYADKVAAATDAAASKPQKTSAVTRTAASSTAGQMVNSASGNTVTSQQQRQTVAESRELKAQQVVLSFGIGLPYVPMVGVLATKYGHDANELGGPVTEALIHAQLSTKSRVIDLQQKSKSLHREVVLLKRTLAEQRKHEQERIDAALRDQKRKIARREARQLNIMDKFLQTKWGDYFNGIGLMEDVPRVLRANVPINNKKMPKKDAEKLAKEIWQAKDELEASTGTRLHLADFTATFLERRFFAIPRLVTEVAYNLIYSLGQHSYDADCNLFLRVFTGDVEEAVRYEQQALEAEIMKLLRLLDVSINHQATGWLHKADVKTALAGFFKGKKVDRLSEIFEALDTDESCDAVHYSTLFTDDDDMNQGMTAETIRGQHLQERLEFMQEIENVIRDTAEDEKSTTLTPAVLQTCLQKVSLNLPPERALDEATRDAFVTRAFGPKWKDEMYRMQMPLGVVIRAIRRGSLQTAMRGPAAATANAAVSKIQPVGKFKDKLKSALKVGMSEPAGSATSRDSRRGSNFGADASTLDRRRSGDFGMLASAAAAFNNAGQEQMSRQAGFLAQRSRRATLDDVTAAVSAVLAAKAGSGAGKQNGDAAVSSSGATQRKVNLAEASQKAAGASNQQLQGPSSTSATATAVDAADAAAQPAVPKGVSSGGSKAAALVPSLSLKKSATGSASNSNTARTNRPGVHSARSARADDSAASKAAVNTTITVDMLSAMEAVRQSWLKEEEEKFSSSGAGASPAHATAPKTSFADMFSLSGGTASAATVAEHQQQQDQRRAELEDSSSGRRSRAASLGIHAVPALRLLEVSDTDSAASNGPSVANSRVNSAREGASTPKGGDTYRPSSPVGLKPILRRSETAKGNKRVQITIDGDSGAPWDAPGSPKSPAGGVGRSWRDHQVKHQLSLQVDAADTPAAAAAAGGGQIGSVPSSPSAVARQSRAGLEAAAINSSASPSRRNSNRKLQPLPSLLLTDADDVIAAAEAAAADAAEAAGMNSISEAAQGSAEGTSADAANPLDPLGLNPGVLASGSGGSLPGSNSGVLQGPLAQDDVCYTPHAPEEGGKINALLMRKLNKGKSLKRLEEVMLMVASRAGDSADAEGEWG